MDNIESRSAQCDANENHNKFKSCFTLTWSIKMQDITKRQFSVMEISKRQETTKNNKEVIIMSRARERQHQNYVYIMILKLCNHPIKINSKIFNRPRRANGRVGKSLPCHTLVYMNGGRKPPYFRQKFIIFK